MSGNIRPLKTRLWCSADTLWLHTHKHTLLQVPSGFLQGLNGILPGKKGFFSCKQPWFTYQLFNPLPNKLTMRTDRSKVGHGHTCSTLVDFMDWFLENVMLILKEEKIHHWFHRHVWQNSHEVFLVRGRKPLTPLPQKKTTLNLMTQFTSATN